jgi:hypothetical protein
MKQQLFVAAVTLALSSVAHAETLKGTLTPTVATCGEAVVPIEKATLAVDGGTAVLNGVDFQAVDANGYASFESPGVSTELGVLRVKRTKREVVTLVRTVALGDIGTCTEILQGEFTRSSR